MENILKKFSFLISLGSKKDKSKIYALIIITLICSFLDIFSITSLYNFLNLITGKELNESYEIFFNLYLKLTPENYYFASLSLFLIFLVLSSVFRILLVRIQAFLACDFGISIAKKIFKNILEKKYEFHIGVNSSEYLAAIINKINDVVNKILVPVINIISSSALLIFLLLTLIAIEPIPTLFTLITLTAVYLLIIVFFKKKMFDYGRLMSERYSQIIKFLQETFGNIRDVILSNQIEKKLDNYAYLDRSLRLAQANVNYISAFPRYVIETIIVLMVGLIVAIFYKQDINSIIPIAGTMIIVLQRSLPLFNQIYSSVNSFRSGLAAYQDLHIFFDNQNNFVSNETAKLNFNKKIEMKKIFYIYPGGEKKIFENANITLYKNKFYGIKGTTGSGKSTFLDLFTGLLDSYEGKIYVDDTLLHINNVKTWQKKISYVSQKPYLYDNTILNNITDFNRFVLDEIKIKNVLNTVCMDDFVSNLPNGINTTIGENAIKLSGGQKQRISLARAIYQNAPILILDEATNALDEKIEKIILKNIKELNRTVLMITHKSENFIICDDVIEIKDNKIKII